MSNHHKIQVDHVPVRVFAMEPGSIAGPNATAPPSGSHPAIVLLHGAGGNLDFWTSRLAPFLKQANIALYAPHYFDRTGTTYADLDTLRNGAHTAPWLAVVKETLRFAAGRPGVDPDKLTLAGVSLGAFLALAFAARLSASPEPAEPTRLRALIEVSGGLIEPYASQATERFPPTLILHGETDTVVPSTLAHSLDRRLTQLGIAHRTEILPNEGHWFSSAAIPCILLAVSNFLSDHLAEPARAM